MAVTVVAGTVRNAFAQILAVIKEPVHPLAETRQTVELRVLQHLDGEERHQTDHRPNPRSHGRAVNVKAVVVETVFLVPQTSAAERVHGVGDGDKVLEKL